MSDEFEKKSGSKKGLLLTLVVIVLIAAVVGGIYILKKKKTGEPEAIVEKTVNSLFETTEKTSEKPTRVEMEFTASVSGNDANVKMVNSILKEIKLKTTTEMDLSKKIFNSNVVVSYSDEDIINASAFFQDEKIYFYLKDLYSKFIEIDEDTLEEMGADLESSFDFEKFNAEEFTESVQKIIVNKLKEKDISQEKVELNGSNVQKTSLKLTTTDMMEVARDVLKELNKTQKNEDIADLIEDIEDELKEEQDTSIYAKVDIYTKGANNDVVKMAISFIEEDEMAVVIDGEKKSDKETVINILVNEDDSNVKDAEKVADITITEDSKNSGTIVAKAEIEGVTASLNVKYKVEEGITVSPAKITDSILITEMKEKDLQEILSNAKKNEFLKAFIEQMGGSDIFDYVEEKENSPYNYTYDDVRDYTY